MLGLEGAGLIKTYERAESICDRLISFHNEAPNAMSFELRKRTIGGCKDDPHVEGFRPLHQVSAIKFSRQ